MGRPFADEHLRAVETLVDPDVVLGQLVKCLRQSREADAKAPLIPNVQEVILHHNSLSDLHVELLLGPTTRALHLTDEPLGDHSALYHWLRSPPLLLTTISMPINEPASIDADISVCRVLCALHHWRHVSLPFSALAESKTVEHLASLPTLTSLEITFDTNDVPLPESDTRFSRLQRLGLKINGYSEGLTLFLSHYLDTHPTTSQPSTLEEVTIWFMAHYDHGEGVIIAEVLKAMPATLLHTITIFPSTVGVVSGFTRSGSRFESPDVMLADLTPALPQARFTHLRSLCIVSDDYPIAADSEYLLEVAATLPSLEILDLCPREPYTYYSYAVEEYPTLDALVRLVQLCRKLRTLRIPANPVLLDPDIVLQAPSCRSGVRRLCLWSLPLDTDMHPPDYETSTPTSLEPRAIASLLGDLFPRVEELRVVPIQYPAHDNCRRGWERVFDELLRSGKLEVSISEQWSVLLVCVCWRRCCADLPSGGSSR